MKSFAQSATMSFFLRPPGELEIIVKTVSSFGRGTATAVQFKARLQKSRKSPENIPQRLTTGTSSSFSARNEILTVLGSPQKHLDD